MITLKVENWQLNYLHWVFSDFANRTEGIEPIHKYYAQYVCAQVTRLKTLKRKFKSLPIQRHEIELFNDLVACYYNQIAHDKRLIIEKRFLQQLTEATKIV